MQLEQALNRAEHREKICVWVGSISFPLAVGLAFLGGSGAVGSFDAFDRQANVVSITLMVAYFVCIVATAVSIASYYTRFRPKIKEIKDQIRDASLLALHGEIAELRKQVELLVRAKDS